MRRQGRATVAAVESACGAIMLVGSLLLSGLGHAADIAALALLFLGVGGLGHGLLLGLGLVGLPSAPSEQVRGHRDEDGD